MSRERPLVSIVTPSFNSAPFIQRTIDSVLSQNYPEIEYIVRDGGSTDGTVAILERRRDRLSYVSEPDGGAADAINQGFAASRGEILAWINADDEYLPGAVATAVERFKEHPDAGVLYGQGAWVDGDGREIGPYPTIAPYRPKMLQSECGICQPTVFLRRAAAEEAGWLDANLHFSFDYEFWMRLAVKQKFIAIPERLALSRMHPDNKTLGKRRQVFEENIAILLKHYGYVPVNWVYGYLSFLRDGRDQFFEPLRHSALLYAAALPVGAVYNRRRLWRYCREWGSTAMAGIAGMTRAKRR